MQLSAETGSSNHRWNLSIRITRKISYLRVAKNTSSAFNNEIPLTYLTEFYETENIFLAKKRNKSEAAITAVATSAFWSTTWGSG
jgi:hypothetical protein